MQHARDKNVIGLFDVVDDVILDHEAPDPWRDILAQVSGGAMASEKRKPSTIASTTRSAVAMLASSARRHQIPSKSASAGCESGVPSAADIFQVSSFGSKLLELLVALLEQPKCVPDGLAGVWYMPVLILSFTRRSSSGVSETFICVQCR